METSPSTNLADDCVDLSQPSNKQSQNRPTNEKDHTEESSEESEEEEGSDISFPRDSAQDLYQFLHRELNNLQNTDDGQKRKFALIRMYEIFVLAKTKAPNNIYQELLPMIQKQLFKRLSDKIEKNRELACLIIKEFFTRSDDLTMSIPYLIPILVERLNAEDLEGVDSLPDILKPPITQKPQVMSSLNEPSEEVRLLLAELVTLLITSTVFDCLRAYTDALVAILRAICMDPCGDVCAEGCRATSEFAQSGGDQLLHFCEALGRGVFTPMVNKHAKVRMAGLTALYHVMFTGAYKFSVNVMEHLIGFRDPNLVPIKDFFETTTKVNYFAMMVADRSTQVREHFYKTVAAMLMKLPDKKDHEGRLFPYLISGLYDQNDGIRETVFELIEELGKQYEEEYEKDIRELKQFGYQAEWLLEGMVKESDFILPYPFLHRPCLGSRILVRTYVRRYLTALYKEVTDWIEENRERASNLLLCSIIYTEDFMTQFLDHLFVALYKAILENENKVVKQNIPMSFRLLGKYCSPKTYTTLIISAIRNDLASFYPHTQMGALKAFGSLLSGTIEGLPSGFTLERVGDTLRDFVKAINEVVIDQIDVELADHLINTLTIIMETLIKKSSHGVDISLIQDYEKDFFYMLIRSLAAFSNFKLANKQEPEKIINSKKKCIALFKLLAKVSKEPERDFFDKFIVQFFNDQFPDQESVTQAKEWAMMSTKWRMFYVVFEQLESSQLQYIVDQDSQTTVFERVASVLNSILQNGDSQNFNVKSIALHQMFAALVNKSLPFLSPQTCKWFLIHLQSASEIKWNTKDEKCKQLALLLKIHDNFLDCKGLKLGPESLEQFDALIKSMDLFFKEKTEKAKCHALSVAKRYLEAFNEQIIAGLKSSEKQAQLTLATFIPKFSSDLIPLLTDYYESVRELAQIALTKIVEYFMPEVIGFSTDQADLLQMLRANVSMGWATQMSNKVKEVAEMEAAMIQHLFPDPQAFLKTIITVTLDETHGRDNLVNIIREFNSRAPFLLLNDYRIGFATNSLKRVELLKKLIVSE